MNPKAKIILFDVSNRGIEWLDYVLNEDLVELSEVFTLDGDAGINIWELPAYDGWDYLLVPYEGNIEQLIKKLLFDLHIPEEKVVYIGDEDFQCFDWESIRQLFSDEFASVVDKEIMKRESAANSGYDWGISNRFCGRAFLHE